MNCPDRIFGERTVPPLTPRNKPTTACTILNGLAPWIFPFFYFFIVHSNHFGISSPPLNWRHEPLWIPSTPQRNGIVRLYTNLIFLFIHGRSFAWMDTHTLYPGVPVFECSFSHFSLLDIRVY